MQEVEPSVMARARHAVRGALSGAFGLIAAALPAAASDAYPVRVVTMVVAFPAGAGTDVIARMVAPELAKTLNGNVVIENRASAYSVIGATQVARAAPDGYTIFMTTNTSHSAAPSLLKSIPYDPVRDFTPLSRGGNLPFMMVVSAKSSFRAVQDVIAMAKAHPGKLNYAQSNSTSLVLGETFRRISGIDVLQVPYKSTPTAMIDLLAGRIDYMFVDLAAGSSMVDAGDLRAIAVTSGERSAIRPDIPSLKEAGVDIDLVSWNGFFGPPGMSKELVAKLNAAIRTTMGQPELKKRLVGVGFDAFTSTPEEFDAFVRAELTKWARLISDAGIQRE